MHRFLLKIAGLQTYACALAVVQFFNGVRTDEAKYLLNIPYPHPPLARWLFSVFDGFAWQEIGARMLCATLMVQAVWLVWDMGRALRPAARLSLCILWLGSAAFVLQAGTVMMAPLTALQALTFLWLLSRPRDALPHAAVIGLLWLTTVFTALQGVLLAPLVIAVLRLRGTPWRQRLWYVGAPLALVALYALGNPLVLASVLIQSGKDAADSLLMRGLGLTHILLIAGSATGTVAGIAGLLLKRHAFILASFLLVAAYVFVGRHDYYAILFLPFLITGCKHLFRRMPVLAIPVAIGGVLCTGLFFAHVPLLRSRSVARDLLRQAGPGLILIDGPMGHEWQYEARRDQEIRRFRDDLAPGATVIQTR